MAAGICRLSFAWRIVSYLRVLVDGNYAAVLTADSCKGLAIPCANKTAKMTATLDLA